MATIAPRPTHSGKLIDQDWITVKTVAARTKIVRQDRQFVARLRDAILSGRERPGAVLGYTRRRTGN